MNEIYKESVQESPGNKEKLTDIITPKNEEPKKKEVKFNEEIKKEEEKAKIDEEEKKNRLSKRLERARKKAKDNEEKNKFRKSNVIMEKAEALEKKVGNKK